MPDHRTARPLIAAHRGGALLWPENSLTAFRGALTLAVDQIETDIHLSRDGEPFILHDPTLDRTTVASGPASIRTWAELRTIALKGADGDAIPHLDDLLSLLQNSAIDLRLELKTGGDGRVQSGLAQRAMVSLDTFSLTSRTTITSFEISYFEEPVRSLPLANRIWLLKRPRVESEGLTALLRYAMAAGLNEVALHVSQLTAQAVEQARGCGLRMGCYGANTADDIRKAVVFNACAFTTDRPDLALELTDERGRHP